MELQPEGRQLYKKETPLQKFFSEFYEFYFVEHWGTPASVRLWIIHGFDFFIHLNYFTANKYITENIAALVLNLACMWSKQSGTVV